ATFFAIPYSVPGWVEEFAADYIESEAEKRIDSLIDAIGPPESDGALTRLAQSIYERNEAQIEQAKANLRNKVHEQWAVALETDAAAVATKLRQRILELKGHIVQSSRSEARMYLRAELLRENSDSEAAARQSAEARSWRRP
ncbi:MAG: hypothetical protein IIB73_12395, partial [Proteobacteria bacterium]|nr:hypothetical protein [Pseudomonadota bacterium]